MKTLIRCLLTVIILTNPLVFVNAEFAHSGLLEVHYINVGQGGSTLIIGPNGTKIIYDFGNVPGDDNIVPYLRDIGISPEDGIDYAIVGHLDRDHYSGYLDVIEAGYDVYVANYSSGSTKTSSTIKKQWSTPARNKTTAGKVRSIPVGLSISLGDGAEMTVIAANGRVYGYKEAMYVPNENDRSIAVLIRYGDFHYILDSDLGGGKETCSKHQTEQKNVQSRVADALIEYGYIDKNFGVDVLHVSHHGSESSTTADYYNKMKPEIALISVGVDQRASYKHPREDVVDGILLDFENRFVGEEHNNCVTAPPVEYVFQTEDGLAGTSSTGRTTFSGLPIGDIKLTTDGDQYYWVSGNNRVHGDSKRKAKANNEQWQFTIDELKVTE